MPDWKSLVQERLALLNLSHDAKEEVVKELALHLEEICDNARADGLADSAATALALEEVHNWPALSAQISRARSKEEVMNRATKALLLSIAVLFPAGLILLFLQRAPVMQMLIWTACAAMLLCAAASEANRLSHRTRSLWLPALATFFGASVSLMVCEFLGVKPRMVWMNHYAVGHVALFLYWPWLASLPLFGAAGAHLSLRAHGSARARLAAGLSPALIMLTVWVVILPWGLLIDGVHFFQLVGFGLGLVNWVAIPGVALLLGAAPFLGEARPIPA